MDEKRIADLRAERGRGMVSAVGEYTPDELWEALDCIERLRAVLRKIEAGEYIHLPTMVREALGPNVELSGHQRPARKDEK